MYGRAEGVIGELAAKLRLRDSLFIATKVWTAGKQAGVEMMERSMDRFQTKRIDLMQVHNLVDVETQMSSLREWKWKGRIRYTGITHSQARGFGEVERIMRSQKPDFVQINYSVMEPGAAQRILPLAQELRMAVIINRPFGGGGLFERVRAKQLPNWAAEFDCRSWAQFFLKWIIANSAVTCAIPATNNPNHLEDNLHEGCWPASRRKNASANGRVRFGGVASRAIGNALAAARPLPQLEKTLRFFTKSVAEAGDMLDRGRFPCEKSFPSRLLAPFAWLFLRRNPRRPI